MSMSLVEVDDLLGRPDWETRLPKAALARPHELREGEDCIFQRWSSSELTIIVLAYPDGRVFDRLGFHERRATVFERVRFWIRRHF
jgi:hypothetical protein